MTQPAPYTQFLEEILITESQIQQRVAELGATISEYYAQSQNLLLVCILKGGVLFLTDLMRHITVPHAIDFMAVSSYGEGARASTGQVRILMDLAQSITDRDVLLVEDIIDSGHTLNYILNQLHARNPRSLRICTLLSKPSRREVDISIDFLGFEIEDKFVFGYGLDLDERFRNMPFIGVVKPEALA
ncbi:MAG: hypoxanthine phosphoribosyltransferase [Phototrophicales bacterium]|nr:MAG: hypoxanthine phosphoribosyltransferase [Phototrophicales bacterium]